MTDKCEAGFYCVSGQNNTKENICPKGFQCPVGSEIYKECSPGTFTNSTGGLKLLIKYTNIRKK